MRKLTIFLGGSLLRMNVWLAGLSLVTGCQWNLADLTSTMRPVGFVQDGSPIATPSETATPPTTPSATTQFGGSNASPTPTFAATLTVNPTPTPTRSVTAAATPTVTATRTATATATATRVALSPTPTATFAHATTLTVNVVASSNGTAGSPISFSGVVSGGVTPYTFSWAFGDGGTSKLQSPTYTYVVPGNYFALFNVTDATGVTLSAQAPVVIASPGGSPDTMAADGPCNLSVVQPLPSGPTVTTPFDSIPNFGQNPTITNTGMGNWSNPSTWVDASGSHRLPTSTDDVAVINGGVTVDTTAAAHTVSITSSLVFQDRSSLNATTVMVLPTGCLQMGTQVSPILTSAMITISDQAIDPILDPNAQGNGVLVLGKMVSYGVAKSPYQDLAGDAHAGDTTIQLQDAAFNWFAGDKILLPGMEELESKQGGATDPLNGLHSPLTHHVEIALVQSVSIDGKTITLSHPLAYDHLAVTDLNGNPIYTAQAANLTRTVAIISQNPNGVRGKTFFTYRADVDLRFTSFLNLGRTTSSAISASNLDGSFPVMVSNVMGPVVPQPSSAQTTFIGNTVFDDTFDYTNQVFTSRPSHAFGVDIYNSHYGLYDQNIAINAYGFAFGFYTGKESGNMLSRNYVCEVDGHGQRVGWSGDKKNNPREGSGYFLPTPNNFVVNNVGYNTFAAAQFAYTFMLDLYYGGVVTVPAFQGADVSVSAQTVSLDLNRAPIPRLVPGGTYFGQSVSNGFMGNRTIASWNGLTFWWIHTVSATPNDTVDMWTGAPASWDSTPHFSTIDIEGGHLDGSFPIFEYETNHLTLQARIYQDPARAWTSVIFPSDYIERDSTIQNSHVEGAPVCLTTTAHSGNSPGNDFYTVVRDSYFACGLGVQVQHFWTIYAADLNTEEIIVLDNDQFVDPQLSSLQTAYNPSWSAIKMLDYGTNYVFTTTSGDEIKEHGVAVIDYNGQPGLDFSIGFVQDQDPNNILPQTAYNSNGKVEFQGVPVAGYTNTMALATWGAWAHGWEPVTCDTTSYPTIRGLVCAFTDLPQFATPYTR